MENDIETEMDTMKIINPIADVKDVALVESSQAANGETEKNVYRDPELDKTYPKDTIVKGSYHSDNNQLIKGTFHFIYICMCVCLSVCMYVCVCLCVCVYIYIYIYIIYTNAG